MRSIYATVAALKTWVGTTIPPEQEAFVVDMGQTWPGLFRFLPGYTGSDASDQLVIAPTTGSATGKWVRSEVSCTLRAPVDSTLANNAVLYTVPSGFELKIGFPWIKVNANFGGGVNSAIGIDSSNTNYNTAGDIIGGDPGTGTVGLLAADLQAGYRGRLGPKLVSEATAAVAGSGPGNPVVLVGGDTIRWNRIVSQFTEGDGFLYVPIQMMLTP